MTITISGLGSGLDYDSWIDELVALKQAKIDDVSSEVSTVNKQEDLLETLESDYQSLLDSINDFTDALSTDDVFNQKTATSSADAVSASVTSSADAQTVKVSVSQLATATTASSGSSVASAVDDNTTVSDIAAGALKTGTFSVYVGGVKSSITIGSSDTMGSIIDKLNGIDGVDASLSNDGKLTIAADSGYTLTSVGSNSDTSNLGDVMSLTRNKSTGSYTSSKSIFDTNSSDALTSGNFAGGTITAGTFTIGNTAFTIDSSTTLDDIIDDINNSDCGATAAWDSNSGKLVLTATDEGAVSINVTAGDGSSGDTDASNFTDIMGLTTSTWDTDGNLSSTALATDSQDLGTNAILSINGTTITSSSNTVTSDISGIKGLTLTLNDVTSSTDTVTVSQNTSSIVTAITSFVSAYNTVISATDDATDYEDGTLSDETVLKSIRNNIRQLATSSVSSSGLYKTLASIGISTGDIGDSTDSDTNSLTIDTDALTTALETDPDSVKSLLTNSSGSGILDKMSTTLTSSLKTSTGYFDTAEAYCEKKVDKLNDKIDDMTSDLETYQESLETKFEAMDELISNLQSSASIFDSYFSSDDSSS